MGRGFGVAATVDHAVVASVAREAERLGFTSFWVNDVPHAEGLASLAAAAAATARIALGVGVIPLDTRPADAIAAGVRARGLPVDRLWLGVGSGAAPGALARVRAGVEELRGDLGAKVVVGALGPRMAALAGETADGVLLNWLTPAYAARIGRDVLDAAAGGGRQPPSLMAYVRCGLTPGAEERLRRELAHYVGVTSFERHVERMGADGWATCVLGADRAALQAGVAGYEGVLDEPVVRAVTPDDDVETILTLLRACGPDGPDG